MRQTFPPKVASRKLRASTASDFDRDGVVDLDDLALWRASAGVNADADADHDGDSDGADFLAWQRQLGNALPAFSPPVAAAVPEPAARGALLLAACVFCRRRIRSLRQL